MELNDPHAADDLGRLMLNPAHPNFPAALAVFRKAIDSGWDNGYAGLYTVYLATRQMPAANRALEAGAAAGVPLCMVELALSKLRQPIPDRVAAFGLMKQAAELPFPIAERLVGFFYRDGVGTPPDPAQSRRWLERALSHNDLESAVPLAEELLNAPDATPRMKEEAVNLLCRGDAAGDGQASYRLAMVYLKSADKDKRDLARKLLERAMSRGVRKAAGALQTLNAENPQTSASPTSQPAKSREPHL